MVQAIIDIRKTLIKFSTSSDLLVVCLLSSLTLSSFTLRSGNSLLVLFKDLLKLILRSKETKIFNNNGITSKDIYELNKNKSEYVDKEKLPLPNINNLRKWIKNEKKAS